MAMSTFGTLIPSIVFEPLDEDTVDAITDDLNAVFEFDPRVRTVSLRVYPDYDTNSVFVEALLYYIELNMEDAFELNIAFEE